jgi:hypothetical protein
MQRSFLLFLILICAPLSAAAQFSPGSAPVALSFSPSHPRPYDQVTVSVSSTLINLSAADITISVNGAVVEEGKRAATFRVGGPGSKTTVRATVTTVNGTETVEGTLRPADIALILEPTATAHPFYDGGLLVPSEGKVRIIALADLRTALGAKIADKDISFSWKVGDKQLQAESGLGKNTLSATAPPRYRDTKITVTASSRDGSIVAESSVSVSPVDPVLRIYPADPLSGATFATALLRTFSFSGSEASFRMVPYFFKETPSLSWRLNGTKSGIQDAITVRSSGGSGSAVLLGEATLSDATVENSVSLRFEDTDGRGFLNFSI